MINTTKYLKEEINTFSQFHSITLLEKLTNYFNHSFYILFLNSIKTKDDNKIFNYEVILNECDSKINDIENKNKNKKHLIIEFIIFWLISFLILFIERQIYNNYLHYEQSNIIYLISVSIFNILFLINLILLNFKFRKDYEEI